MASVGHEIDPMTMTVANYVATNPRQQGRTVLLVDTPGFASPAFPSDRKVLKRILLWLKSSVLRVAHQRRVLIVYLLEIDQRLGAENGYRMSPKKLCKAGLKEHLLIATTKWNAMRTESKLRREKSLSQVYGCRIRSFLDTQDSAWDIIDCTPDTHMNVTDLYQKLENALEKSQLKKFFTYFRGKTSHSSTSDIQSPVMKTHYNDDVRQGKAISHCTLSTVATSGLFNISFALNDLGKRVLSALHDTQEFDRLISCQGDDAQALLDVLQWVLISKLSDGESLKCLVRALCKLCFQSGLYPSQLKLPAVDIDSINPVISSVFSDTFKGTLSCGYKRNVCVKICLDVAKGLEFLHAHSALHGELRGDHILVDASGRAYIAGFSHTKISDDDFLYQSSESNSVTGGGNIRWWAPELLDPDYGRFEKTPASDVYAWASLCYEIFTSRIPFFAIKREFNLITTIIRGEHPSRPPKGSKLSINDETWALMEQCWSRDPHQRLTISQAVSRLAAIQTKDPRPPSEWADALVYAANSIQKQHNIAHILSRTNHILSPNISMQSQPSSHMESDDDRGSETSSSQRSGMFWSLQEVGKRLIVALTNSKEAERLLCYSGPAVQALIDTIQSLMLVQKLNILVNESRRAYVGDFGLAAYDTLVDDLPGALIQHEILDQGSRGGTVRWQAPELLTDEEHGLDENTAPVRKNTMATDVYAWGCICFEIFTGRSPFFEYPRESTVLLKVNAGARPTLPGPLETQLGKHGFTESIWILMNECWTYQSNLRPTIKQVISYLNAVILEKDDRPVVNLTADKDRLSHGSDVIDASLTLDALHEVLKNPS
ncbi:hypothetical protein C0995_014616 [Termitomyces sp. Mi166|nr:hypothetical protein C0995_014616 [Termitomyces sp. Mi166\